ncbi:actin-like ATPase domain-containing protein [Metschnikowia bicuspidata var. bicuspidata NRRL YB-4993]|uniref:Xylulose kinase n=1 Tax=Metschnikowia bicuspidata var. bicuspidata NRRL YB-4993 TaxID=869754 RepID=A0A1A0HHE7_9ASCO|nr:actin-like ATPase domain-containing protein [Metschnikowia bicuspidata var. bicuspidata NRRL YB-4993]OBA23426.1 actin-like ATPase domain-containing protein [Metschnikowia bicuspidata var. bicuspidata NRRL YB-4993]
MTYDTSSALFLGFDLSTQQLKIIVTDKDLQALATYNVEFDAEFKDKYKIKKGVLSDEESGEILSPVHMWLDAMDYVFDLMKKDSFPFEKVKGISGSGMQHGSVFWSNCAASLLDKMHEFDSLSDALGNAFACDTSPNWQDHSTGQEIEDFEKVSGGPDKLAETTGSRAHYRFTGLQIRKLAVRSGKDVFENTDRISLVSSFIASVLLGKIAPIEEADGCGMNLYNIAASRYDEELLSVAAGVHPLLDKKSEAEKNEGVEKLKRMLGDVEPVSYKHLGTISSYFVKKYGFSPDARIFSFTGDNLATIISLPLQKNDVLVSLGTSTTVLLVTENYQPSSQYHLFKHPSIKNAYMGMICYSNGALAREKVRDAVNEEYGITNDSWDKFNEVLDKSEDFKNRLGVYFPIGEIVPNAPSQTKRMEMDSHEHILEVDYWDLEYDVSSIVESQTVSCRVRAGPMLHSSKKSSNSKSRTDEEVTALIDELHSQFGEIFTDGKPQTFESLTSRPRKIFFVGGASRNKSIIHKMASIMGATEGNYQVEIPNACALGGAYKASWSYECESMDKWIHYNDYLNQNYNFDEVDHFDVTDKWANYIPAIGLLSKLENALD